MLVVVAINLKIRRILLLLVVMVGVKKLLFHLMMATMYAYIFSILRRVCLYFLPISTTSTFGFCFDMCSLFVLVSEE